jgi:NDP-sugar pyrophosphorylase family protein
MRLRPYTTILPKPLLPIGDRPILEIILRQLAEAGFSKGDLCVGHLGELIRVYFSEGTVMPDGLEHDWDWERRSRSAPPALCVWCRGSTAPSSP